MADWTTAITIVGSFGVASTAQIISHEFAKKRDNQKYNKESLQNLYSPLILQLRNYIDAEGHWENLRRDHGNTEKELRNFHNPDLILQKIMDHVEANLKYSSAEIIIKYEEVRLKLEKLHNNEELLRDVILVSTLSLCSEVFIEFIEISKELGTLSHSIKKEITSRILFTQFYLLLEDVGLYAAALEAPAIIGSLNNLELSLSKQDNWIKKCRNIRQKISKDKDKDKRIVNLNSVQKGYKLILELTNELREYSSEVKIFADMCLTEINRTQKKSSQI